MGNRLVNRLNNDWRHIHRYVKQASDAVNRVAILSPGYPNRPGGVTDHTARLEKSWSDFGANVHVFGKESEPIASLVGRMDTERVNALLIQYVPFLYGRRGLSALPESLAVSCQALGIRVTTFVHEPWVPPTRLPWLLLSPLQKRQLKRVIAVSDSVVTAVPKWAAALGPTTKTVYVGSTLGNPPSKIESEPPLSSPVVFSPFASGLRWDWITAAVQSLGVGLVVVGSDYETFLEHPNVGRYANGGWDYRGRMSAEEALRLLARARLVLAPFVDGITARRTSAMAALSCGSRLLTSSGHLCDTWFAHGPATVVDSSAEFSDSAIDLWETEVTPSGRAERIAWFDEHLSPADLDSLLLSIVTAKGNR